MDDLIVKSKNLEEHVIDLIKVFKTLNKFRMKLNLDKSIFISEPQAFGNQSEK